ncbi:NAD-dependent histone deacetylase sirtuin-1 [Phymastichus coffea]|uniref:NAD-dependent histone deacetylase sirtuin-1 n=1 Tax=Phymastichus coffea TaxID=108790 RepID=UPI00273BCFF9|nr:NAD-dependent histone deacetylase sirtuin-1 [Phymastichus coffea]
MASGAAEPVKFAASTSKRPKHNAILDSKHLDQHNASSQLHQQGTLRDSNAFSELSDVIKSASTSSDVTNSSTPTRTDSMSDDTGFPIDTADEKDEVSSTVSNLSELSGISGLSDDDDGGMGWRSALSWVQKQIQMGTDPRDVLKVMFSDHSEVPEEVDDITLWKIVINRMSEPPKRQKLSHINTMSDVVQLIKNCKNIIVLTGAGVSVSCGIPDFRSRDGIYTRLAQDFPDLPDPQAMFDINYFSQDPRPFYKFAREIYPGQFKPSPCHKFIKMLDEQKKLLRNYSQNIDTLERVAGIKNLIECHGSFATASCTKCKHQVLADDIREDIFAQNIPMCPMCQDESLPSIGEVNMSDNYKDLVAQGVMKPDIVFFGEGLPDAFHDAMANDKDICDLLIVIGSSLKVRPVALIPSSIPANVPQILINRESLPHLEFDIELLGDADVVINQLCHMLNGNFKDVCWFDTILEEAPKLLPPRFPINDAWDQSQDTSTQDFSQDSAQVDSDNFIAGSSSSKREFDRDEKDKNNALDDRPWKKIKGDTDLKELFEDEPISHISCTKFYSSMMKYYDKKGTNTESDNDSVTDTTAHSSQEESQDDQKENNQLDDRPWIDEENKSKNNEKSSEFSDDMIHDAECMDVRSLSFHSEYTERTVKNFTFIEESHKRQLTFDNSPKSVDSSRKSMTLSSGESPTTSYESSSRAAEEIFIADDCHVVPRIDLLRDDFTPDNLNPSKSFDKLEMKPRHASIDSVMDSALGDSCSSSDCQKRKNDNEDDDSDENKKSHKFESHSSWQHNVRDSLASRLPENAYYQMKPGKYIFPGAEVYTNFPWNEGVLQFSGLRSALTETQLCDH